MKKKLTAMLLALTMLLALAACGGTTGSEAASSAAPAANSAEQTAAPSEQPETSASAEVPATSQVETISAEPEQAFNDTVITYPLSDGEHLSIWCAKPGGPPIVRDSWSELEIFQKAEEHLGVTMDWTEVDMFAMESQFNLMIAAGDYTDIISGVVQNYSTGVVGAYEDGVVIDIADLVYDNMPNYWNLVHADSEKEKYVTTEDGQELAIYVVNDQPLTERGLLIRSDWLDTVGMDIPETFDELEDVLTAFKNEYNCSNPLYVGETGLTIPALTAGYGIEYYDDDLALYVGDDNQLVCSYMTEDYRDYVEMFSRWIKAGLVNGDMLLNSESVNMNDTQTYICNENTGAFHTSANQLSTYYTYSSNKDFDVTPINVVVRNAGDDTINHFGSYEPVQSGQTVSISTDCANPALALRWIDYWYSEEGTMYMTYGIEDYTYTVADDGTVTFTDMIVNNTDGMSPEGMIMKYNCQGKICGVMMQKALWAYYSDKQKEVMDFWSTQVEYDRSIPSYVTLTTEESTAYNGIVSDITAYAESELTKFLFGDRDISEWDAFTAELEAMGINDAIAIYQGAYDRQAA